MQSKARTVEEYLRELPPDRRAGVSAVREVILKNLPAGYREGMGYGMIGYHVPHSLYPAGYHCDPKQPLPFAALASQKNYMALYLMCIYSDRDFEAWFRHAWAKAGKKLDMGKSCIRFKKLEDVPLDVIGQVIKKVPVKEFIRYYESQIRPPAGGGMKKTAAGKRASAAGKRPVKAKSSNPAKRSASTSKRPAAKRPGARRKVGRAAS
jgi:hypothetical protein